MENAPSRTRFLSGGEGNTIRVERSEEGLTFIAAVQGEIVQGEVLEA
jgi:hypothetical protein